MNVIITTTEADMIEERAWEKISDQHDDPGLFAVKVEGEWCSLHHPSVVERHRGYGIDVDDRSIKCLCGPPADLLAHKECTNPKCDGSGFIALGNGAIDVCDHDYPSGEPVTLRTRCAWPARACDDPLCTPDNPYTAVAQAVVVNVVQTEAGDWTMIGRLA